jgi:methylglutaconyl-CoA hydratase
VLRAIGARQASRYFLTAERIDARKALEIGLAHEVVEEDELHQTVGALAEALLAGGPLAQGAAKALIRDMAGQSINDSLVEETAGRIAALRVGGEAKEGLAAFIEKRPPHWTV